jgi:hypothetical protein
MKCPRCWTQKAYLRKVPGWRGILLACLLLQPMKCLHCRHKFVTSWFFTLGKQVRPPKLRIAPISRQTGPSYAAQHHAAARFTHPQGPLAQAESHPERADAA